MTNLDPKKIELLSAYFDGELSSEERVEVEKLASQPGSEEVLAKFNELRDGLQGLPRFQVSPSFQAQVFAEAARRSQASPSLAHLSEANSQVAPVRPAGGSTETRRRWEGWLVLAGVLAILVVLGLPAVRSPQSSPDEFAEIPSDRIEPIEERFQLDWHHVSYVPNRPPQYVMVVDVTLTPTARDEKQFETILLKHGIRFGTDIFADEELERSMLASRFVTPLQKPAEAPGPAADPKANPQQGDAGIPELVYVVDQAENIDRLIKAMEQNRQAFARVKFDLALAPADLRTFERLREAGDAQLAEAMPAGESGDSGRIVRAQRVLMTDPLGALEGPVVTNLAAIQTGMAWVSRQRTARWPGRQAWIPSPEPDGWALALPTPASFPAVQIKQPGEKQPGKDVMISEVLFVVRDPANP